MSSLNGGISRRRKSWPRSVGWWLWNFVFFEQQNQVCFYRRRYFRVGHSKVVRSWSDDTPGLKNAKNPVQYRSWSSDSIHVNRMSKDNFKPALEETDFSRSFKNSQYQCHEHVCLLIFLLCNISHWKWNWMSLLSILLARPSCTGFFFIFLSRSRSAVVCTLTSW